MLPLIGLIGCTAQSEDGISPEGAKRSVEKVLDVKLQPDKELQAGMKGSYTTATSKNYVAVGIFDDASTAKSAAEAANGMSQPGFESINIINEKNVIVIYATIGKDRSKQVKRALSRL